MQQNQQQRGHIGLQSILDTIKSATPGRSLAIFDLDSTLYDLTRRVTAILHGFAQDPMVSLRHPELCLKLLAVEVRRTDWGLHEPLGRLGISPSNHAEFIHAAQTAWARGFFSNDFLHHDVPLPGAVAFVDHCLGHGADVLYLTGRDTARMSPGTEESLRQHRFPLDGKRARLMLKQHASHNDAEFKASVIETLVQRYDHVWLFENEPVNINAVLNRTPEVKIVFVDTCHSGVETVTAPATTVTHFELLDGT